MHSHVADPPEWSIACSESILYFSTYYYYGINNYRLGIARDITRRKQAEEQLATRQAQLEEAQALARLGNWSWDIPSGTLNWSYELYRRFGREPKEFVPTHEGFLELLYPADRAPIEAAIEGAQRPRAPAGRWTGHR